MKRFRKAVVAGVSTAAGVAWTAFQADPPKSSDDWAKVIGGAVVAGVLAGMATYAVKNEPAAPTHSVR